MAKSVLSIIIETLRKGKGDKETIVALKQLQSGLTAAAAVAGTATAVYFALDKTLGASVRTYVSYAAQVRQLSQITNESAESTSRTIQVADDYKISIESLEKAQKQLATQGKSLSTETLAGLSDAFLKLNDGAARQNFLSKEFGGKTGQDFAEAMSAGGDAILARGAAVQAGLILDEKALRQTRELELAQDDLGDSIQALKITIGRGLVPELANMAEGLANSANFSRRLRVAIEAIERRPLDNVTLGYLAMAEAAEKNTQAVEENAAANKELLDVTGSLQQENDKYNQSLEENAAAQADVRAEIEKAIAQGYKPAGRHMKELYGDLRDLQDASRELADAHAQATKKIVLDLITQKMAFDGLDDKETEVLLDLQEQWGFIDADTAAAARRVLEVTDNLNGLDGKEIGVAIHVALDGAGAALISAGGAGQREKRHTGTGPTEGFARGGRLGSMAIVGEEGPELIINGFVIPSPLTRAILRGGKTGIPAFATGGLAVEDSMIDWPGGSAPADSTWYGAGAGYGTYDYGGSSSGGSSGGSSSGNRAPKTPGQASSVAKAVNAAQAQTASVISDAIAAQSAGLTSSNEQGNRLLKQVIASIDALPDKLAAKLQQGFL